MLIFDFVTKPLLAFSSLLEKPKFDAGHARGPGAMAILISLITMQANRDTADRDGHELDRDGHELDRDGHELDRDGHELNSAFGVFGASLKKKNTSPFS